MSVVFRSTCIVHYVPSWRTQHVPQKTTDKGRGTLQTVILYKIDEKHLQWFLIVFSLVSLSLHLWCKKNFRLFHLVFTPYAALTNLRSVNRCIVVALGTFHSAVLYMKSFQCHLTAFACTAPLHFSTKGRSILRNEMSCGISVPFGSFLRSYIFFTPHDVVLTSTPFHSFAQSTCTPTVSLTWVHLRCASSLPLRGTHVELCFHRYANLGFERSCMCNFIRSSFAACFMFLHMHLVSCVTSPEF